MAIAVMLLAAAAQAEQLELLLESQAGTRAVPLPDFAQAAHAEARWAMVHNQIEARGLEDVHVLEAMRRVPRYKFVPRDQVPDAYRDSPLPIGYGQTISQPFIVAYMSAVLGVGPNDRVLEVGTGSAYQAAVLAELVREVVSIEIIEALARDAARRLKRLGYRNISVFYGDGYFGHPEGSPYDAIIVTAAASHVPPPLIAQLKRGGRMAIPVGETAWTQNLLLVEKDEAGNVSSRNLIPVAFVPLTGGH
jgi:protein-L-isoaspartate(D-aspartate) O-methyltransferase